MTRRSFVQGIAAGVGASAVVGPGARIAMGRPVSADDKTVRRVARLAHLTDVHAQPQRAAGEGFAECLRHVHALEDRPDMILFGGDLVMDVSNKPNPERTREQLDVWNAVMRRHCSLPYRVCIGNHDVHGMTQAEGKRWAMESFGLDRRYDSFEKFGWHVVILDSTAPKEEGGYAARLDEEQFAWLEKDLADTPADRPVLVLTHIPILTVTAYFDGDNEKTGDWVVPGAWMHLDARRIKDLFLKHPNVRLCLSGHEHLVDESIYNGVTYCCNGAVCGAWWKGTNQEFDAGYGIIDLYEDGSFRNQYVVYGWEAQP